MSTGIETTLNTEHILEKVNREQLSEEEVQDISAKSGKYNVQI